MILLAGGLLWWGVSTASGPARDEEAGPPVSYEEETAPAPEPPPPDWACRIRGAVLDGDAPVTGAQLLFIAPEDVPAELFLGRLTGRLLRTDPEGRFDVTVGNGNRILRRVVAPGRGGLWRAIEWDDGPGAERELTLALPPRTPRTITVEPADAELFVLAKERRSLPLLSVRAKDGEATLPLADDDVLLVRAPGRAVYAGPPRDVVRLEPAFRLAGVVVDPAGRVVRAATLTRRLADGVFDTATTDLDGRFSFAALPAAHVALFVSRAGFASRVVRAWPGDESLRVRLQRVRPTRGRVVDVEGEPVVGATVFIDGTRRAVTGEDGRFRVDDTPGGVRVRAEKDGLVAEETAAGGAVELVLRRPESIAVRFLDPEGRPVPGMRVRGVSGRSGPDGRLALPASAAGEPASAPRELAVRVRPGEVTVPEPVVRPLPLPDGAQVRLRPGDGWWEDGELFLHPAPLEPRLLYVAVPGRGSFFAYPWRGGEVELEPYAVVRGRVAPGATVGWGRVARTKARADGTFVLRDLRAGRRTLWTQARDGDVFPLRALALEPGGDVDLGDLGALESPEARVRRGRVTNAAGAPVGGARVRPLRDIALPFTLTRADGSYALSTPHRGPLLVEREGFAPTPTTGDDVVLHPGGTVELRVAFGAGPKPDWTALLARGGTTFLRRDGEDGRLVWDGLPPGMFELGVRVGDRTTWREVAIRDGESTSLTVEPDRQ